MEFRVEEIELLFASFISLSLGPLIYRVSRNRLSMLSLLDGFIFVCITGLVVLSILPAILARGHWWSLLFAFLGMFGPTFTEKIFKGGADRVHSTALVLGLIGLCTHAAADGAALTDPHLSPGQSQHLLPFAVILHRLPVGLTIWWLVRPIFGVRTALAVFALVIISTTLGFGLGPQLLVGLSSQAMAWFQALVAGSLLHVVFHQPGIKSQLMAQGEPGKKTGWFEGSGALLGIGLMAVFLGGDEAVHGSINLPIFRTFLGLALRSAPALLLAYLVAGFMSSFLSQSSIRWMNKGAKWTQAVRGMSLGLPFPICSCGVVPLYRTLVQRGAPATAAMAFLISTPELGLDAVLMSIPLLGTQMTVARVLAAALVAFSVGWIVGGPMARSSNLESESQQRPPQDEGQAFGQKVSQALKVGLGEVVDHTAPWILFGLTLAAIAESFLQPGGLTALPSSFEVILFTLLGLPTYVCASSATPFVAVLLAKGVSPGAALAFLLTGPATNVTTFGVLGKLHSTRVALKFSLSIILLSAGLGYLTNALLPQFESVPLSGRTVESASLLELFCLICLAFLYARSLLRRGTRKFVGEISFRGQHA